MRDGVMAERSRSEAGCQEFGTLLLLGPMPAALRLEAGALRVVLLAQRSTALVQLLSVDLASSESFLEDPSGIGCASSIGEASGRPYAKDNQRCKDDERY